MPAAASTMSAPSLPAAKYSAFDSPNGCASSGGEAASRNIHSASRAAARLTSPSSASESRPTEPVTHHASDFNAMVSSAVASDSHA